MNVIIFLAAVLFTTGNGTFERHSHFPSIGKRMYDSSIVPDLPNATVKDRESCGWFNLIEDIPYTDEYHDLVFVRYERMADGYKSIYNVVPRMKRVRRYSKLNLITASKRAGKWNDLKAFIRSYDIEDEWIGCQYFEDGNALFVYGTNAIINAGIATDKEVNALLDASVDE